MDSTGRVAPAERPADVAFAAEQAAELPVAERVQTEQVEQREPAVEATPPAEMPQRAPAAAAQATAKRDPMIAQIENVLQDGVFEAYMAMGPAEKQAFKTRGEQVAGQVRQMLAAGKVQAKKIWQLIREWLRLIPGVSSLFVEQEAKIKTDRIVLLARTGMR